VVILLPLVSVWHGKPVAAVGAREIDLIDNDVLLGF